MKWVAFLIILLALVLLAQTRDDQYAVMVYESRCIELTQDKDTRIEFPMVNGEPDKKHGVLLRPVIKLKEHCAGHYEVRKIQH